jgi:7-cyano-7-deazaguanine synthase in queuosine biosynthesis
MPSSVVLFSGGLDSLGGVVKEVVQEGRSALLITHESTTKLRRRHQLLRDMIDTAASGPRPQHITVRVNKRDQTEREYTQRARSFLYASLAVAAARMARLDAIRFYENGIVSLNLPLSPQVVGSRATRTTHPRVLACMRRLFSLVTDTTFGVDNGFIWKTKSDVVRDIVASGHGSMIPHSTSCTHTWVFSNAKPHCGTCSQCIDRRFAVLAGGAGTFERADTYSHDLLVHARDAGESRVMLASYVETAQQVAEMSETEFFSRFGEAARVLMHVGLPADQAARKVHQLYQHHGKQVMSVIEAALDLHKSEIRKRTLPESCLIRLVCDPNPVVVGASGGSLAVQPQREHPPYQLVQMGQWWILRFNGVEKHLELSVGMVYLREMIAFPGKTFSSAELYLLARPHMKDIPSARSEAAFDETAKRAYWERLRELDQEIESSERTGDVTAANVAKNEKRRLCAELEAASFNGRFKTESSDQKRLRDRVRNGINRAIATITKYNAAAGAHFDDTIKRCSTMTYRSTDTVVWQF